MNKAEFKAIREMVGLTLGALASELGEQVNTVLAYESGDTEIPYEAERVLKDALEQQKRIVRHGLEIAKSSGATNVALPYWTSADEYEKYSTDAALGVGGDWQMANANQRAVACLLEDHGFIVEWREGNENPARPK